MFTATHGQAPGSSTVSRKQLNIRGLGRQALAARAKPSQTDSSPDEPRGMILPGVMISSGIGFRVGV